MRKALLVALFFVILFWPSTFAQQTYEPPEVTSAGVAWVPYVVVFDGLFVLDVRLSDEGVIERIEPLRDPGYMLGTAKTSVRGWKFQSAAEGGKPKASRLTVVFLYRPPNQGNATPVPPKDFVPVIPSDQSDDGIDYVPVGISSFIYPDYPVNSIAWGSVVVQVTVDSTGEVKDVSFLHRMIGFDGLVLDALKKWRLRAATLRGKPVNSKIVIAFVFQTPPSSE